MRALKLALDHRLVISQTGAKDEVVSVQSLHYTCTMLLAMYESSPDVGSSQNSSMGLVRTCR